MEAIDKGTIHEADVALLLHKADNMKQEKKKKTQDRVDGTKNKSPSTKKHLADPAERRKRKEEKRRKKERAAVLQARNPYLDIIEQNKSKVRSRPSVNAKTGKRVRIAEVPEEKKPPSGWELVVGFEQDQDALEQKFRELAEDENLYRFEAGRYIHERTKSFDELLTEKKSLEGVTMSPGLKLVEQEKEEDKLKLCCSSALCSYSYRT